VPVDRDGARRVECGRQCRAVQVAGDAAAGHRRHRAVPADAADAVVVGIGDVDVAVTVDGHADRSVEAGGALDAVGVARLAAARQRAHAAVGCHLADRVVVRIGHVEVAQAVDGQRRRRVECRGGAKAVREARMAAGEGGYLAVGRDAADAAAIAAVGHEHVAVGVDDGPERIAEAACQRRHARGPRGPGRRVGGAPEGAPRRGVLAGVEDVECRAAGQHGDARERRNDRRAFHRYCISWPMILTGAFP